MHLADDAPGNSGTARMGPVPQKVLNWLYSVLSGVLHTQRWGDEPYEADMPIGISRC